MNFVPPRSATLQALAQKTQTQDLTLEELRIISKCCEEQREGLKQWILRFEKHLVQGDREIHQCQLPLVLRFFRNSLADVIGYQIKGVGLKMVKFFTHDFDSRPGTQKIALQIYGIVAPEQSEPISEDEINLVFRMINKFGISGSQAFYHLMTKISTPGQPVNIIHMINKFDSLSMLENLINWDRNYYWIQIIDSIIDQTVYAFMMFIDEHEGEKMEEKKYSQIKLKFLSVVEQCIKQLENEDIDNQAARFFLDSIIHINKYILAFEFDIQNFYLDPSEIDTQYIEPQDRISQRLYQSGILHKLEGLNDQEMDWQYPKFISVINIMIRQIDWDDFQTYVIPLVQGFIQKGNAMEKTKILSQMLIKFIYTNKEYKQSKQMFIRVFCESQIFNGIVDTVDKRIEKMMVKKHYGTKKQKEDMKDCSNLFYILVLAFEIIEHCQILSKVYKETRDLLEKSVGFFKEVSKFKCQGKVLDKLLSQMLEQQKNEKIQDYQSDRRRNKFHF